jgi:hypothetical protein
MGKVALIIIYNHQYNKNIEKLEHIYKERFTHIYHLVPFYKGEKDNVIPVYESSYYFQGYVAQGLKLFYKEEYEHYFFIGDDLLLNPTINENNYREALKLGSDACLISRLSTLDEAKVFWPVNITALLYNKEAPGVEAQNQLPTPEVVFERLKKFGVINKGLSFYQLWKCPDTFKGWVNKLFSEPRFVLRYLKAKTTGKQYHLSYPLARSYSDIFVVSAAAIKDFCHYCGVFAATRLFVELAVPTAMVLSATSIVKESDISYKGRALWTKEDYSILEPFENNLQLLLQNFPKDYLYLHPVKLSKWIQ